MALKTYKPTTPSQRHLVIVDRSGLHTGKPVKGLVEGQNSTGGRNNHGRITSRFRGGGHKQAYRVIDFKRTRRSIAGYIHTASALPWWRAHRLVGGSRARQCDFRCGSLPGAKCWKASRRFF